MSLLELHNVTKLFPVRCGLFGRTKEFVHAVNCVSLSINEGEIVGLVGESGCGKSTLGRLALGLYKPTSGAILFEGFDIRQKEFRRKAQIIFQDPFSSLNPRMSVGDIISEPLIIHKLCKKNERFNRAAELLESVGLSKDFVHRYPHEFSGGQRQRICIARAIAMKPKLIVADEPVSSLDVAIQADILALLKELHRAHKMAYLFISHDLRVVASLCSRVIVMYLGKIVEELSASFIRDARHPYTIALLRAVPVADPKVKRKRLILGGDIPSPVNLPNGCPFHPRCAYKEDICERIEPVLEKDKDGYSVACHFTEKVRKIW